MESKNTHCKWCSAYGCTNSKNKRPDLSFFKFPSNPDRCKKWVTNTRRADLLTKSVEALNRAYVLCSEHFEKSCFVEGTANRRRTRLRKTARPTIFNVPNPPPKLLSSRRPPKQRITQTPVDNKASSSNLTQSTACPSTSQSNIIDGSEITRTRSVKKKLNQDRVKIPRLRKKLKFSGQQPQHSSKYEEGTLKAVLQYWNTQVDRDFAERLVMEVQLRPLLYDSTHPDYKDRNKMDFEWAAVATAMHTSSDVVRKKWQNLRGSYSRSIASRMVMPNGSETKRPIRFYLDEQMSFLRPHMVHDMSGIQDMSGNYVSYLGEVSAIPQSPSESQEIQGITIKCDPDSIAEDGATETEGEEEEDFYTPSLPKKRLVSSVGPVPSVRQISSVSPAPIEGIERALIKFLDKRSDRTNDSDLEFFKGLLPQVRELSHRNKRDFFHQVSNLLYEALNLQDSQKSLPLNFV